MRDIDHMNTSVADFKGTSVLGDPLIDLGHSGRIRQT